MSEASLMREIQIAACNLGWRLLRNNIGMAWSGNPCKFCRHRMRPIRYGVGGKGWPDTIGWKTITITPEMVGQEIAQFAGVEIKTDDGILEKEQADVLIGIIKAKGIGIVARSVHDLERI